MGITNNQQLSALTQTHCMKCRLFSSFFINFPFCSIYFTINKNKMPIKWSQIFCVALISCFLFFRFLLSFTKFVTISEFAGNSINLPHSIGNSLTNHDSFRHTFSIITLFATFVFTPAVWGTFQSLVSVITFYVQQWHDDDSARHVMLDM